MKTTKVIIFLLSFFLLFLSFKVTTRAVINTAPQKIENKVSEVNSYELFWPVVAGKVAGDKFYILKTFKEKMRGALIFGNTKKAEYYLLLSEKRLVEFEKLAVINKDLANSSKTLKEVKSNQKKVISYLKKAKEQGLNTSETAGSVLKSFNNQVLLLESLATKVDSSQKTSIEDDISYLNSGVIGL